VIWIGEAPVPRSQTTVPPAPSRRSAPGLPPRSWVQTIDRPVGFAGGANGSATGGSRALQAPLALPAPARRALNTRCGLGAPGIGVVRYGKAESNCVASTQVWSVNGAKPNGASVGWQRPSPAW